jgi:hypothetical protein
MKLSFTNVKAGGVRVNVDGTPGGIIYWDADTTKIVAAFAAAGATVTCTGSGTVAAPWVITFTANGAHTFALASGAAGGIANTDASGRPFPYRVFSYQMRNFGAVRVTEVTAVSTPGNGVIEVWATDSIVGFDFTTQAGTPSYVGHQLRRTAGLPYLLGSVQGVPSPPGGAGPFTLQSAAGVLSWV